MRIFLHIGTGRTGTQALQDYLKRNGAGLDQADVLYPILERRNHHNALALPVCGPNLPRYLLNRYGGDVAANMAAFESFFDEIEAQVRASNPATLVLSSEFLGREFPAERGERLFARLRALSDDITVLVYFRSPADYYLSATLQTLKASGNLKHPNKQVARRIIQSWEPLGARMVIREYNRTTLLRQDVCADFASVIDPTLPDLLTARSKQKNETLSAEVMGIIQDYRNAVWPAHDNKFNDETDLLLERLVRIATDTGLYRRPMLKPHIAAALNALDEEMLWLRDTHGFSFSGVDYSATPQETGPLSGDYAHVSDICEYDPAIRARIELLGLAELNRLVVTGESLPPAAEGPAKAKPAKAAKVAAVMTAQDPAPDTDTDTDDRAADSQAAPALDPAERARIRALVPVLRRPEHEVYGTPAQFDRYRKEGLISVRDNFPPIRLEAIRNWKFNPEKHVVWRIYFNSFAWTSVFADTDSTGASQTPDWDAALRMVKLFVAHAEGPDAKPDIWDDHATGYRASYLAWLYAAGLADIIPPGLDRRLRALMLRHRDTLMEYLSSGKWKFSNHTLFQAEGLADLALVFLDEPVERERVLDFVRERVDAFIARAVTREEGTVKEHSVFYHVFLMGRLKDTCAYFDGIGLPLKNADDAMFLRMNQFLHDIMPMENRLPGIGDTKHNQVFASKYVAHFDSPAYRNPRILGLRSEGAEGEPHPFLATYPTDGYYIFRNAAPVSEQLFSTLLHRPFKGPHGHWDGMSFVCWQAGQPVLIDCGGPYKYSTPLRYKYFQTQLAHNSLIFDRTPVRLLTRFLDSAERPGLAAVMLAADMGPNKAWMRVFGQFEGKAAFALDLPLSADGSSRPEVRFHLDPDLAIETAEDGSTRILRPGLTDARLIQQSFAMDPDAAAALLGRLQPVPIKDLPGEYVSPEERERVGLAADFDERSYVTYKDNQYVEGKVLLHEVPVNAVTTTLLSFAPGIRLSVATTGEHCAVVLTEDGQKIASLMLDLGQLQLTDLERAG